MLKISLLFKKFTNFRIIRIKNAKFSEYCFYMNTNMQGDFEICISVPLSMFDELKEVKYFKEVTDFKNFIM